MPKRDRSVKRLFIALGAAFSVVAASADTTAIWASFEDQADGAGIDGKSLEGAVKFVAGDGGVDASIVSRYNGDAFTPEGTADKTGALAPTIYPNEVASQETGDKYLSVDTASTELSFDVSPYTQQFLEDGIESVYLDTLVQFTATDTAPEVRTLGGNYDRLAVWMKGIPEDGSSGPKLMVTAGYLEQFTTSVKNYELNADVEEGKWYRLTIKAYSYYLDRNEANYDRFDSGLGFQIYLDGVLLASTEAAISPEFVADWSDEIDRVWLSHIEARTIFPALPVNGISQTHVKTMDKVVLKGDGKIDNFVLMATDDPDKDIFQLDPVTTYELAFQCSETDSEAIEIIIGTTDYAGPRLYRENDPVSFTFAARPGHILTDVQVGTPIVPDGGVVPEITMDDSGWETRWYLSMPGNYVTIPLNFTYVDAYWVRKSETGGAQITAVDGGALDLSKQIASGTEVSFKVSAPEGSHVSSVTLTVNGGEAQAIDPDGDGVYSFEVAGTTLIAASAEEDAPPEVLVTPGVQGAVYATEAEALAAKAIARVQPDDNAATYITDLSAYDGLFGIDVIDNGDGTYSLKATLTAETIAAIVESLEDAIAGADVADAVDDAGWISIDPSIAGLYYALKEGSVLGDFKVSAVTIGDGGEVRFDLLNKGVSGFYKVDVTAEAQEVEE